MLEKEQPRVRCSPFDVTFVITHLPTVLSLLLPQTSPAALFQASPISVTWRNWNKRPVRRSPAGWSFRETFVLREKYGLWTDKKKKNEGRSLCKVFLIRKKEALYANLLTCVFSASATLVSCKRKVHFVTSFSIIEMVHRCSLKHPCQY